MKPTPEVLLTDRKKHGTVRLNRSTFTEVDAGHPLVEQIRSVLEGIAYQNLGDVSYWLSATSINRQGQHAIAKIGTRVIAIATDETVILSLPGLDEAVNSWCKANDVKHQDQVHGRD